MNIYGHIKKACIFLYKYMYIVFISHHVFIMSFFLQYYLYFYYDCYTVYLIINYIYALA